MNSILILSFSTDAQRWEALVQRNSLAEGVFVYAVKTTRVYCRPTCTSRLPKEKNVIFFLSGTDAEKAGFRSCKRCQPYTVSPARQSI